MTDYWKSNPRKYCEVCKCWFGDNEASVSFHEQGRRHKANVQRQLREARTKASEDEKDKKKTEQMLASIEHAAISAYHKDLTAEYGDLPVQKAVKPVTEDDEAERKILNLTSTILAEKQREVEKNTIKENIDKKVQQLKQESISWQPLLSPEGYTYYYNAVTGVSQWEPPAGYAPVPQAQPYYTPTPPSVSATTEQLKTSTHASSSNTTESSTTTQKRPVAENASEGPSSPKRSRPSGPYGRWETIAEYVVEEPIEDKSGQEPETKEEKEPAIEFEEKTLPVQGVEEDNAYSGGFKKFSFNKKRGSGRAQIRQRSS